MFALKNIFSSMFEKAKNDPKMNEKKPLYTNPQQPPMKDYTTFDQEVIARTKYLLGNKD
jgi:hypothetical protein